MSTPHALRFTICATTTTVLLFPRVPARATAGGLVHSHDSLEHTVKRTVYRASTTTAPSSPSAPQWVPLEKVFNQLSQDAINKLDQFPGGFKAFIQDRLSSQIELAPVVQSGGKWHCRFVPVDEHLAQLAYKASMFVLQAKRDEGKDDDECELQIFIDEHVGPEMRRYAQSKFGGSVKAALIAAQRQIPDVCWTLVDADEDDVDATLLRCISDLEPVSPHARELPKQQQTTPTVVPREITPETVPKPVVETTARDVSLRRASRGENNVISSAALAGIVPSFFVPFHLVLDPLHAALGYTEEHIFTLFATGKLHPLEVVEISPQRKFGRLHGAKGRFDMLPTLQLNQERFSGVKPQLRHAKPYVDVLRNNLEPGQLMPLRQLIELGGEEAAKKLPYQFSEALLFFAQMQHLFMFTPSSGGMVGLRPDADLASNVDYMFSQLMVEENGNSKAIPETAEAQQQLEMPPAMPLEKPLHYSSTPCPIFHNQLQYALLQFARDSGGSSSNNASGGAPIAMLPQLIPDEGVWQDMLSFFPSFEHFMAAHQKSFVVVDDSFILTYEAWERRAIKAMPIEEQMSYFHRRGDTKRVRHLRRQQAMERNPESPYQHEDFLAQTIQECLPFRQSGGADDGGDAGAGRDFLTISQLMRSLPSEVRDFLPPSAGIVGLLRRHPDLFEVFDIAVGMRGVRRRIPNEEDDVVRNNTNEPVDINNSATAMMQDIDIARSIAQIVGQLDTKRLRTHVTSSNSVAVVEAEGRTVFKKLPVGARSRIQNYQQFRRFLALYPESFVVASTDGDDTGGLDRVMLVKIP